MSLGGSQVKIILIETTNSGNIGSALRAMKTMGFSELILINPKNFPSDEALAMSANASDLLDSVKIVTSLDEALEDTNFVVATSSRMRRVPWPCESLEEASPKTNQHLIHPKLRLCLVEKIEDLPMMSCKIKFTFINTSQS